MINRTNLTQGQGALIISSRRRRRLRGESHGRHKGYVFANAWAHQTVESCCIALMVGPQGDAEIVQAQELMKATTEDWIPENSRRAGADGYLQTAYTLADRNRWPERLVTAQSGRPRRLRSGLLHRVGDQSLTRSRTERTNAFTKRRKKLADCWVANLGPDKKEWFDGHQEMDRRISRRAPHQSSNAATRFCKNKTN